MDFPQRISLPYGQAQNVTGEGIGVVGGPPGGGAKGGSSTGPMGGVVGGVAGSGGRNGGSIGTSGCSGKPGATARM